MAFSFFGCASFQGPDTNLYQINAPAGHAKGYNLKTDYDERGNRRSDAVAVFHSIQTVADINKWTCTDIKGFENLKVWMKEIRESFQHCQCSGM